MNLPLIPGPNNELIPETPFTSSQFPVNVDFATSASYAETASFTLGYILSSSYANFASTASYLLGSIANAVSASWADFSGHSLSSDSASWADRAGIAFVASHSLSSSYSVTASYALQAKTASYSIYSVSSSVTTTASYSVSSSYASFVPSSSYALTASYALNGGGTSESASYLSGSSAIVPVVTLANPGINAYITSRVVTGIVTATPVDTFSDLDGNSVKWLISINDGASFKTSEIIAIWEPVSNMTNFAEVTTNTIGTIPVAMSVNISANQVRLIANPASGSWTVKSIRFVL